MLIDFAAKANTHNKRALEKRALPTYYSKLLKSEFLEEVVTLIINKDECWEVLNVDLPDSLHSKFWVLNTLNALDVVLSKDCCRTTD